MCIIYFRGMSTTNRILPHYWASAESRSIIVPKCHSIKVSDHFWTIALLLWLQRSVNSLRGIEEHMVRKIADLIYVEHKDFIDAKLRVKKKLGL